jgi:hypothetical protein
MRKRFLPGAGKTCPWMKNRGVYRSTACTGTTAIDVPFAPLPLQGARIRYRLFPKVAL